MARTKQSLITKLTELVSKSWAFAATTIEGKTVFKISRVVRELFAIFAITSGYLLWNAIFRMDVIKGSNTYFSYILSQLVSQKQSWYIWLIIFIIAVFVLTKRGFIQKKNKASKLQILRPILISSSVTLLIIILSLNLNFISTHIVGVVHTNILLSNINKGAISEVIWGKDKVQARLESLDRAPNILESASKNLNKDVVSIYMGGSSLSQYYTKEVIAKLPNSLLISTSIPKNSFLMVGNNLVVVEIKDDEIQQISPVLGYKLVKAYFGSRYIKSYPEIKVLGRQDYLKFREDQINKRVKTIESVLADVKKALSVANNNVAVARNRFSSYTTALSYIDYAREQTYSYCVEMGAYYSYYTPSYCRSYTDSYWNSQAARYQQEIKNAQANLVVWQKEASYWANINKYVTDVKTIVEGQKNTTPYELGVFHDDNKIEIALDETNSMSIYPYVATLTHEYMHYTSNVSNDRNLPLFFEESLTEYYSRKVFSNSLEKEDKLGYPILVKVIEQMHKKIDPKKFEEIYFNKDQKGLEAALDEAYGKEFYKKNSLSFEILPLLGGEDQIKAANEIMEKIGGEKLKLEDFK